MIFDLGVSVVLANHFPSLHGVRNGRVESRHFIFVESQPQLRFHFPGQPITCPLVETLNPMSLILPIVIGDIEVIGRYGCAIPLTCE